MQWLDSLVMNMHFIFYSTTNINLALFLLSNEGLKVHRNITVLNKSQVYFCRVRVALYTLLESFLELELSICLVFYSFVKIVILLM